MAKPIMNEATIVDYMKRNKCNREEAIDLINYDIAVENGEETEYDLTPEQKQVVTDMVRHTEHKRGYKKPSGRKPNEIKEGLMAALADFLENECEFTLNGETTYCDAVELTNVSRMLHFKVNDKEYDLQLIEKRGPNKRKKWS